VVVGLPQERVRYNQFRKRATGSSACLILTDSFWFWKAPQSLSLIISYALRGPRIPFSCLEVLSYVHGQSPRSILTSFEHSVTSGKDCPSSLQNLWQENGNGEFLPYSLVPIEGAPRLSSLTVFRVSRLFCIPIFCDSGILRPTGYGSWEGIGLDRTYFNPRVAAHSSGAISG